VPSSFSNFVTTPATVLVPAGQKSATFAIATSEVTADTTAHTRIYFKDNALAGHTGTLEVLAVRKPRISAFTVNAANIVTVRGGSSATGAIRLVEPAPRSGAAISLTNSNPDIVLHAASLNLSGNETGTTFTITTRPVNEPRQVNLTAQLLGESTTARLWVYPPRLTSLTVVPKLLVSGITYEGTVTFESAAPANGITVRLSSSKPLVTELPRDVVVQAGNSVARFYIQLKKVLAKDETVEISASAFSETKSSAIQALTALKGSR
jgi:hypothetical protein